MPAPDVNPVPPDHERLAAELDDCRRDLQTARTDSAERAYRADERDRTADERDHVADDRENLADDRERLADVREGSAEERERKRVLRVEDSEQRRVAGARRDQAEISRQSTDTERRR
jgi:hypothetical protein